MAIYTEAMFVVNDCEFMGNFPIRANLFSYPMPLKRKSSESISTKKKGSKLDSKNTTKEEDKNAADQTAQIETNTKMSIVTRNMVLASQKWVGAHVSIVGGLHMAIKETINMEGNACAIFLRSQRRWDSPPLLQKSIDEFESVVVETNFGCSCGPSAASDKGSTKEQILPHGSYLINLGNPDEAKRTKGYSLFVDDLKRCDSLNIALYNFHPGSTCGETSSEKSISFIAECINMAHKETKKVKVLLENMAGQGNVVGSTFEELADIINQINEKERIGVCLDTCHLFSAGYDISTPESWNEVLDRFDKIVGIKYLSAMHLNDSKGPLGCRKDRHENIGKGYIGLECFKFIMRDDRFKNMPLVLETPVPSDGNSDIYRKEIQLLYSFLGGPLKRE